MKRFCLFCGQTPDRDFTYPHNTEEAIRWQSMLTYFVPIQTLQDHCCVCNSHINGSLEQRGQEHKEMEVVDNRFAGNVPDKPCAQRRGVTFDESDAIAYYDNKTIEGPYWSANIDSSSEDLIRVSSGVSSSISMESYRRRLLEKRSLSGTETFANQSSNCTCSSLIGAESDEPQVMDTSRSPNKKPSLPTNSNSDPPCSCDMRTRDQPIGPQVLNSRMSSNAHRPFSLRSRCSCCPATALKTRAQSSEPQMLDRRRNSTQKSPFTPNSDSNPRCCCGFFCPATAAMGSNSKVDSLKSKAQSNDPRKMDSKKSLNKKAPFTPNSNSDPPCSCGSFCPAMTAMNKNPLKTRGQPNEPQVMDFKKSSNRKPPSTSSGSTDPLCSSTSPDMAAMNRTISQNMQNKSFSKQTSSRALPLKFSHKVLQQQPLEQEEEQRLGQQKRQQSLDHNSYREMQCPSNFVGNSMTDFSTVSNGVSSQDPTEASTRPKRFCKPCTASKNSGASPINVLIMGGSTLPTYCNKSNQSQYLPDINVLEADFTQESATFPDIDVPQYTVCRAPGEQLNGVQKEQSTEVLLVGVAQDEDNPCATHPPTKLPQPKVKQSPNTAEKGDQKRMDELESLFTQQRQLQQTIQAKLCELLGEKSRTSQNAVTPNAVTSKAATPTCSPYCRGLRILPTMASNNPK